MRISRNLTAKISFILDQLVPPIIRDSKWFSYLFIWPIAKKTTPVFLTFRDHVQHMTDEEFNYVYKLTNDLIQRDTDLNNQCFNYLVENITEKNMLEVGCGKGLLAKVLATKNAVTALDIDISPYLCNVNPDITWIEANAEEIPLPDKSYDVVVCTHTLEHVRSFDKALAELRRLAREKIYIVVPLQRPYRYTLDLHISFFPYPHSFIARAMPQENTYSYEVLGGDLLYIEECYKLDNLNAAKKSESIIPVR